jgi:hypothetical protein
MAHDRGAVGKEAGEKESKTKIKRIEIEPLDGGGFLYTAFPEHKPSKGNAMTPWEPHRYAYSNAEEVMEAVADDLKTPHMREKKYADEPMGGLSSRFKKKGN